MENETDDEVIYIILKKCDKYDLESLLWNVSNNTFLITRT